MDNNYTYPAIVEEIENEIHIFFPQFDGCETYICKGDDVISNAQDILTLVINDYEDTKKALPECQWSYKLKGGQKIIFINVWMPYHRSKIKEVYVKKTLTIPVWLNELAQKNNINFSAALVKALKDELHLNY